MDTASPATSSSDSSSAAPERAGELPRPLLSLASRLHSLFVTFQQRAAAVTAMAEEGHELEVSDRELEGYVQGLTAALEAGRREVEDALENSANMDWPEIDSDYEALCRALACVDIIGICFVYESATRSFGTASRLLNWYITHHDMDQEITEISARAHDLLVGGQLDREGDAEFWQCLQFLASMDMSKHVAHLLTQWLQVKGEDHEVDPGLYEDVRLLATFYADIPSVNDITTHSRTTAEFEKRMDNRMNLAYSGWSKVCATGKQHDETAFMWKLNASSEEDMDSLIKRMCELTSPETGPVESDTAWYLKVILEYFWFYPNLTVTGGGASSIVESAAKLLSGEKDASVTPMDVVVHACLTGDVSELLTSLSADGRELGGSMVVCHIVDLLYYSGSLSEALPAERDVELYRDGRLKDYVNFLTSPCVPKALGYRLAEDYAAAAHEDKLSRNRLSDILMDMAEEMSPTDNDVMSVIKRSLDHRLPDVALDICSSRFESLSDTDVLSAIRWLERSQDISGSRKPLISDYLDKLSMRENGVEKLVEIFKAANRLNGGAELGRGRLGFYSRLASAVERPEAETIARLLVSDDCPSEALPMLLRELKRSGSCDVSDDEAMAVWERLQDRRLEGDEGDLVEALLVESFLSSGKDTGYAGSPQASSVSGDAAAAINSQWVFV
ncbi:hypothetical protein FOL47_001114 [Perkinsus chesapeaki]|uniref:Nuclear pore complex protein Nup85 n=1 Tax=Perkinsus chesapeaki TaxID=330153 RepID=A0A7J6MK17_PERCH|nr:hypothetical protein FOL47_001114 [Perkinsus chesapeaki]